MNETQLLFNQQLGLRKWRTYDSVLRRFQATEDDEFKKVINVPASENEYDPPVFASKFCPNRGQHHILALANEDGKLAIHNSSSSRDDRYGVQAHDNAIFDLAWMMGKMKLVTVSGDHTARLFDVSNAAITEENIFNGHTRSVKTVAFKPEDTAVFATGSRDGCILVWDTRVFKYEMVLHDPDKMIWKPHNISATPSSHSKSSKKRNIYISSNLSGANSVTSLVFQDDNTLISCSAGDGIIKAWDLRKNYKAYKREPVPKYTIPYAGNTQRNGFSHLLLDPSTLKLYVSCLDNNIYCYNISSYSPEPIMKYTGHENSTFYIKSALSSDGRYLLSGSSDHNAYIWNVNDSNPIVYLSGHTAEVTCVAWSESNDTIVTCSDDMRHILWRVGTEMLPDNWDILGRGKAEISKKQLSKSNKTPRSQHKRPFLQYTPHSAKKQNRMCEKCAFVTPGSLVRQFCDCIKSENENLSGRKRLAENNTSEETDSKRARRLFSPIDPNKPSCSKQDNYNYQETDEDLAKSLDGTDFNSPTMNLPNFVIDGEAPHLNLSPEKRVDRDWLTKLRTERVLIQTMQELAAPSPSKIHKVDSKPSPKTPVSSTTTPSGKKRVKSVSKSKRPQSPLLKFFRITNNSIMKCDQQCSPKSSTNSSITQELHSL